MKELGPDDRPEIDYPCAWSFRVIGEDEKKLRIAIADSVSWKDHTVEAGATSSKGRYVSLHVELEVEDEAERLRVYSELGAHPDVRMVL